MPETGIETPIVRPLLKRVLDILDATGSQVTIELIFKVVLEELDCELSSSHEASLSFNVDS